jgi:two-component system NarL family sensor kinase
VGPARTFPGTEAATDEVARPLEAARTPHPLDYRVPILLAALVAVVVWWGLGLPYSLTAWLLDDQQLKWTLICYAWEVPAAGLLGPVLVPQIWWRDVVRHWDRVFATPGRVDAAEADIVEGQILDYPIRVGWVLLVTSLVGYGVGAIQLWAFAQLPVEQLVHVALLGLVTGLVGALFAFLYLERLLARLLFSLGRTRATAPPAGRHVPLRRKVFASTLMLMVATVLLFGTVFWNQSARVLEQETAKRLLVLARDAAGRPDIPHEGTGEPAWRALVQGADLGATGRAYIVDGTGHVVAGTGPARRLSDEGFRPSVTQAVLAGANGYLVDRLGAARLVAFARAPDGANRVVLVVPRAEFDRELREGLRTSAAIFLATLLLAVGSSYLFSRRLGRPIELVTAMANRSARQPDPAWELTPVRTNDEVGELAVALNQMTSRLGEARDALARYNQELEDRVNAATRNVRTLYDTTRAITSTLVLDDVLQLIEERVRAALGLRDVVVMRRSPVAASVDAYATGVGHLSVPSPCELPALARAGGPPRVYALATVANELPPTVRAALGGPEVLALPLFVKDRIAGVVLGSLDPVRGAPDLEFAGTLAIQTAVALTNVGLFEAVQRHEIELRELSERQVEMREELLRTISRDLHDGLGQSLAAIKLDLSTIEQSETRDAERAALRERLHGVQAQVAEVIQEVRRMSQLLRPSMLDDLGLVPSLRMLVDGVSLRAGFPITLQTPDRDRRLAPAIEVLLYRVTQEALTNMVKHAQPHSGRVALELDTTHATLTISDDGVGFDAEALRREPRPSGVGLLGMRERVTYHHGAIEIRSRPGAGVRITLRIPIDQDPLG